ncbi:hypothetical protein NPIL_470961 [Nephila pilipes]|uniref:Uncharacterized protein n=1 Tax=Nephila pilipes TaxID=299642 RepID=A0A8X6R682_NEPPI|nr:hypothetical protein NPIL_470961 [Nephila pilipes]
MNVMRSKNESGENTKECKASNEQPLTAHYPLSWEKIHLTVPVCAKNPSSECFFRNPAFGDRQHPHDSRGVLDRETKRKLRVRAKEGKKRTPVTRLGNLGGKGRTKDVENICVHYLSIKEREIMELFFKSALKSACRRRIPFGKKIRETQCTRFKENKAKVGELEEPNGDCHQQIK